MKLLFEKYGGMIMASVIAIFIIAMIFSKNGGILSMIGREERQLLRGVRGEELIAHSIDKLEDESKVVRIASNVFEAGKTYRISNYIEVKNGKGEKLPFEIVEVINANTLEKLNLTRMGDVTFKTVGIYLIDVLSEEDLFEFRIPVSRKM